MPANIYDVYIRYADGEFQRLSDLAEVGQRIDYNERLIRYEENLYCLSGDDFVPLLMNK